MGGPRTREELNSIVLFNSVFFGTLAWLASAAVVANADGWWYERGQIALALAGIIGFWVAWWLDAHGRTRHALQFGGAAVADLSLWVTSVHQVLF
ncbi:MAG TPA: hypothetical protein VHF45_00675 [Thermoleophilaceae bacterium]|jgi:hypothetical protein|nr:hypothetical protein [Thermoleophilaceae bacterium]